MTVATRGSMTLASPGTAQDGAGVDPSAGSAKLPPDMVCPPAVGGPPSAAIGLRRAVALREQGRVGGEAVREELAEGTVHEVRRPADVGDEGAVPGGVEGGDVPALRARQQLLDAPPAYVRRLKPTATSPLRQEPGGAWPIRTR